MSKVTKGINYFLIYIAASVIILLIIVSGVFTTLNFALPILPTFLIMFIPLSMYFVFWVASLWSILSIFFQAVNIEVKIFYPIFLTIISFFLFEVAVNQTALMGEQMFSWGRDVAYQASLNIYSFALLFCLFIMGIFPKWASGKQSLSSQNTNLEGERIKNDIPKQQVSPFNMLPINNQDANPNDDHIENDIPKQQASPFEVK